MPLNSEELSLLDVSRKLLAAIDTGDWETYAALCDDQLTCFEPEARGHLVGGLPFHQFYFDLPQDGAPRKSTISSPRVRIVNDVGIVCYVRLVQGLNDTASPVTASYEETRIWQRVGQGWKHVHFHRSGA